MEGGCYFSVGFVPCSGSQCLPLQQGPNDKGQKNELLKLSLRPQEVCAKPCQEGRGHWLVTSMIVPQHFPARLMSSASFGQRGNSAERPGRDGSAPGCRQSQCRPPSRWAQPSKHCDPEVLLSDLSNSQPGNGKNLSVCSLLMEASFP